MPATDPDIYIDPEHHDGTSDATPGGEQTQRRPGELVFAAIMLIASLALLWSAYGIAGFDALSSPGAIPMATTLAMVITAGIILFKTAKLPLDHSETVVRDILPPVVLVFAGLLIAYGILLRPLGFLPTSALFLIAAIKLLARRGWGWTIGVSLGSLITIWLIFRIVFSVLMPSGVVPEAEFIQFFRNMINGGAG
ncbi:MAG TPA: tripartite tricarboxylate transporter TctB family protein [Paracoccus sp. (in: a-proteobacteria)]|uniref:tripartite tricarboxylate transporter TctB family protein n=1 Tax=uncultured Paracoccus sp. TaxID=189685 RepID=UPI00260BAE34|nr:tripartite tricarboxylate transporter TctB family protein [uncultured Paracoccus sp.]HMQ41302.1 tripartite tricarboxylate transporter TctB family protein [Paracoccus sp. (in: a-proteobacteria)]HMR36197.1 tripartite tricarboxylate transporter TctB family protein [Paracoccus sp. (in: a-proteobacteria)]